ncbi:MAG TPA: hypothetical protein VEH76_09495 [Methylocystis sp.]|nr:hypothetical protein [Methylocystis sp.]
MEKFRVRVVDPNCADWQEGYRDYEVEAVSIQAAILYLRTMFPYASEIIELSVGGLAA